MLVLGIESSCDETAAALVSSDRQIRSNAVFDQADLHSAYGGVVPEIAARAHAERLDLVVERALAEGQAQLGEVDLIAATSGPGLIGGVISGLLFAKALSAASGIPFIGVNHLAGHALTPRLTDDLPYPYLLLLVSGGHCQFLAVQGPQSFRRLGGTIDDAPGEAFDKTARLLGLGYPGGPEVDNRAQRGDAARFAFPRPLLDRPGCDMSFSGLKTAIRREVERLTAANGGLREADRDDLCAGFQAAVADILAEKTTRAIAAFAGQEAPRIAIAGGVAANSAVRRRLAQVAEDAGATLITPPLALCTDNAAMIAWAGLEAWRTAGPSPLDLAARPRWPLDQSASAMLGSGKKGAKA